MRYEANYCPRCDDDLAQYVVECSQTPDPQRCGDCEGPMFRSIFEDEQ